MKMTGEQENQLIAKFESMQNLTPEIFEKINNFDTKYLEAVITNLVEPSAVFRVYTKPNIVIDAIAFAYSLTGDEIRHSKKHEDTRWRCIAIYCLKKYVGLPRRQIGRYFGMTESGVAKAINRVQKRRDTDWWFSLDLDALKEEIKLI